MPQVFDERRCALGEGPTSRGEFNSLVTWVDILGKQVHWHDLVSHEIGSFSTASDVGFTVPKSGGGYILGSGNSLLSRDVHGVEEEIFQCQQTQDVPTGTSVRWNDAKVSPLGDLFAGSMANDGSPNAGQLYRISKELEVTELLSPVSISNGLDWNVKGDLFYYIDTLTYRLDVFDHENGFISNRRPLVTFDPEHGMPDGMCSDSEDGMWVAFFGGSRVVRYSSNGDISMIIPMPVKNATSCAFAGENLDQLVITTAQLTDEDSPLSGMTFVATPGVKGKATIEF